MELDYATITNILQGTKALVLEPPSEIFDELLIENECVNQLLIKYPHC